MSLSPQQRWALRQKANKRCTRCSKKLGRYQWLCNPCQAKATSYIRRYREAQKIAAAAKAKALGK